MYKGSTEMIGLLGQLPPNGCRILFLFAEMGGLGVARGRDTLQKQKHLVCESVQRADHYPLKPTSKCAGVLVSLSGEKQEKALIVFMSLCSFVFIYKVLSQYCAQGIRTVWNTQQGRLFYFYFLFFLTEYCMNCLGIRAIFTHSHPFSELQNSLVNFFSNFGLST